MAACGLDGHGLLEYELCFAGHFFVLFYSCLTAQRHSRTVVCFYHLYIHTMRSSERAPIPCEDNQYGLFRYGLSLTALDVDLRGFRRAVTFRLSATLT